MRPHLHRGSVFATTSVVFVAAVGPTAAGAGAAPVSIRSGETRLHFTSATVRTFRALGITTSIGTPARRSGRLATFPIARGGLDPTGGAGIVRHSGTLTFRRGSRRIAMSGIRTTIGNRGAVRSTIGGTRVTTFSLDVSKRKVRRANGSTIVTNVTLRLTAVGARRINRALGTTRFAAGRTIARVRIRALPKTLVLSGGSGTMALTTDTTNTLRRLGVDVGPGAAGSITAPIVGGSIATDVLAGTVEFGSETTLVSGPAARTASSGTARLGAYRLVLDGTPTIAAVVNGRSLDLIDLNISDLRSELTGTRVTFSRIPATLTPAGATAITQALGIVGLRPGTPIGTLTVAGVVR